MKEKRCAAQMNLLSDVLNIQGRRGISYVAQFWMDLGASAWKRGAKAFAQQGGSVNALWPASYADLKLQSQDLGLPMQCSFIAYALAYNETLYRHHFDSGHVDLDAVHVIQGTEHLRLHEVMQRVAAQHPQSVQGEPALLATANASLARDVLRDMGLGGAGSPGPCAFTPA